MNVSDRLQAPGPFEGVLFWASWYVVSLAFLITAPIMLSFRRHLWNLEPADTPAIFVMGLGYIVFALLIRLVGTRLRQLDGLVTITTGAVLCFVLPWFVLTRWKIPTSRVMFVAAAVLGIVLAFLPILLRRFRTLMLIGATTGTLALGVFDFPQRKVNSVKTDVAYTEYYGVSMRAEADLLPPRRANAKAGGSIARFGDGFLLVNAGGDFYRLNWGAGDSLKATRLALTAPFNLEEFIKDQDKPQTATVFRVADLAVDERGPSIKVYLAHHHWNHDQHCMTMRVSSTTLVEPTSEGLEVPPQWQTIFESQPCLSFSLALPRIDTNEGGGGLALHPQGLLLSLGDNGIEGLDGEDPFAQAKDVSYGKVLFLDLAGNSRVFSMGHRNPQGLTIDNQGRIWETEHGPQGGDELNLLVDGGNYGWPFETYGTEYGIDHWPLAPKSLDHGKYIEPVHAFVPSIGISQIIQVSGDRFPMWAGDFLVASLRRETLYRVRTHGERVIYVEPFFVGSRIRDLAQGKDGRIVLWTDAGEVISLSRAPAAFNGRYIFVTNCAGCHEPPPGGTAAGAPDLHGIIGRAVASSKGFAYSGALLQLGGRWTEERLNSFIEDPSTAVPGTNMAVGGVSDPEQRRVLLRYLAEYR